MAFHGSGMSSSTPSMPRLAEPARTSATFVRRAGEPGLEVLAAPWAKSIIDTLESIVGGQGPDFQEYDTHWLALVEEVPKTSKTWRRKNTITY